MTRYLKIWLRFTEIAFKQQLVTKSSFLIFAFGKVFRFVMYFLFLLFLLGQTKTLAGYSQNQALFVFLMFTIIDSITQMFFRGTYMFRPLIVDGGFDYFLIQPISPLFRSLVRFTDAIDLFTFIPLIGYTLWFFFDHHLFTTLPNLIIFFVLLINGILISTAAHISVLSTGILFLEVDNTLWLYRDLTAMGRFPIDVYQQPLRGFLTFVIPIGIMFLFPNQALFGTLSPTNLVLSLFIGPLLFWLSIRLWKYALSQYSSASS